ncbi:MAG TPA: helix-turn-helix transcriptional regulator [Verrucomicrobia bacterium]|nr:helix-turn-helix transcriptional regulator [Verrucomicrobiota bacterium]HOB32632.1 AraC family transcriptional regulator [Verrucomicrobiota bacterium]HOP97484.1 AraC family transcriptional regulator [Verrucomicrobiota bacterium]HPU55416.1 AraC family transcriptional regulator [Verrucomicrobiota bacterium]
MFSQEHLALRLVRLKTGDKWAGKSRGLVFIFPKAGIGRYCTPIGRGQVRPGDILVVQEWHHAVLHAEANEDVVFWFFAIQVEHMFPLFGSAEISLLQNVVDGLKSVRFYSGATELARDCHRMLAEAPPDYDLGHRSQLLRIAASLLAAEFRNAQSHRAGIARADQRVIQVFEKLSTQELLNLSVAELAARFGCSQRHLNRLFHRHFGCSVAAMRMEMRLLKAICLLRDPDAKIISVAEQCGFNHLGLFNTCFKRRFNISPGRWRKQASERDMTGVSGAAVCPLSSDSACPWNGFRNGTPDDGSAEALPPVSPGRRLVSAKGLAVSQPASKSDKGRVNPSPACPECESTCLCVG